MTFPIGPLFRITTMTNELDSTLITAAKDRARLSSGELAELLGVGEKTIRRSLQGESLPPSMRLLVQLIAALPWIVPILKRLRDGLPLEDDAGAAERDPQSPGTSFRP